MLYSHDGQGLSSKHSPEFPSQDLIDITCYMTSYAFDFEIGYLTVASVLPFKRQDPFYRVNN